MSTRRRYRAPDDAVFARLMQQRSLGGFAIRPMSPLEVRDRFLDTADGALLQRGLTLRLRTYADGTTVTLRPLEGEGDEEVASQRLEPAGVESSGYLPEGPVRGAVEDHIGHAELQVLLSFRQYRTPRALFEGERLVGVLSLDVLADQTDGDEHAVSNEVEIELLEAGTEDDLERLHAELRADGFEVDTLSKFERGLFRRERRAEGSLLLLPRERRVLEALAESEAAVERRRAQALLRAAAGEDDRSISRMVGLAPSRVRHWREAFRLERTRVFEEGADLALVEDDDDVPTFTVSTLIGDSPSVEREPRQPVNLEDAVTRVLHRGVIASGGDSGPAEAESDRPHDLPPQAGHEHEPGAFDAPHHEEAGPPDPFGFHGPPAAGDGGAPPGDDRAEAEHFADSDFDRGGGEPQDTPSEPLLEPLPLAPTMTLVEAVRRLVGSAADAIDELAPRLAEDAPYEELLHLEALMERITLGLELGQDALPEHTLRRLTAEADRLVASVEDAASLRHAAEAIDMSDLAERSAGEQLALALARTVWSVESRRELAGDSGGAALDERLRRFNRSVRDAAASVPAQASGGEELFLQDTLGSRIWRQYEEARVALRDDEWRSESRAVDHRLGRLEAALAVVGGEAARMVHRDVARARAALRAYHLGSDLRQRLRVFADDWLATGGVGDPEALGRLRLSLEDDVERAADRFQGLREELFSREFRSHLASAAAGL